MTNRRIEQLSRAFRSSLVDETIPFWLDHATDRQYGGYTTFLDRKGDLLAPTSRCGSRENRLAHGAPVQ